MSFKFERTYTETFEVEHVKLNFVSYRIFHRVRKDVTSCEFCDKDFQQDDFPALAFISKNGNKLICYECGKLAIDGGANELNWDK